MERQAPSAFTLQSHYPESIAKQMSTNPVNISPGSEMRTQLFIGGEWCDASDGVTFPVEDPSTETTIAEVASATVEDVTRAVEIAHEAGREWARRVPRERAEDPAPRLGTAV